ncbi:hypothetical protein KGF56_003822 [Candida oxycetoniae]|uniref:NAD(P)-binding protein n=1 Tax=Candida oxycetoniae TaxID=497107 RepID=A0AAI9WWM7_9ASCO|nr:uncharacterized protein KGF56_003822 [Candida oxycetoniae]KAI3403401.2 hypothetical protein KGF56_003822 [Candida oxycetoniae]
MLLLTFDGLTFFSIRFFFVPFTRLSYILVPGFITGIVTLLVGAYNLPPKDLWSKLGESDIAVVTGGSRGLGSEITKQLLQRNVIVYMLDRQEPVQDDMMQNNPRLHFINCDLGDEDQLHRTITELIAHLRNSDQYISVLVNNAGIRDNKSLVRLDFERVKQVFNVNTLSQVFILQKVVSNHLKYNENGKLSIVTVSSILGTFAPKNLSIYSASKAAQIMLHDALQQELKQHKRIRLLLVTSGQMDTELFKDVKPTKQLVAPVVKHAELAKTIVEKVDIGFMGCLSKPLYANFLPGVRTAPMFVQDFCRWVSEMDEQIKEEKD